MHRLVMGRVHVAKQATACLIYYATLRTSSAVFNKQLCCMLSRFVSSALISRNDR